MKAIVPLLFLIGSVKGFSQNLVTNNGFEDFYKCPESFTNIFKREVLPNWTTPSPGTPDYFNVCSKGLAGVPNNWTGISNASEGNGYIGFYLYRRNSEFKEHIQGALLSPLKGGKKYRVGFKLNQAFYAQLISKKIEISFSNQPIKSLDTDFNLPVDHDKILSVMINEDESGGWNSYVIEFVAAGGESYLTIGNLSSLNPRDFIRKKYWVSKEPMLNQSSYVHIDDVSVFEIKKDRSKKSKLED